MQLRPPLRVALLAGALFALHAAGQTTEPASPLPSAAVSGSSGLSASPSPARRRPPVDSIKLAAAPDEPLTRSPGWEARALKNIAASQKTARPIELIFDGDSITDRWQGPGRQVWAARFAPHAAFDFGISGDLTQSVLWRLSKGQGTGLHPKLIALMIGTNDMQTTATPEEIAGGVKKIIAIYHERCPEAVILLQAIFPRAEMPDDPYRLKVKKTNEFLAKLGDGQSVVYADFGDKFLNPDGTLSPKIMPDFLHPSAAGYEIWADAIQPIVDRYVK